MISLEKRVSALERSMKPFNKEQYLVTLHMTDGTTVTQPYYECCDAVLSGQVASVSGSGVNDIFVDLLSAMIGDQEDEP